MSLNQAQKVILQALDALNLSGELLDDSNRPDADRTKAFFARDSVQFILNHISSEIAKGTPLREIVNDVVQKYGVFLKDACAAALLDVPSELTPDEEYQVVLRRKRNRTTAPLEPSSQNEPPRIVRVPADWLDEPQRREVLNYLAYIQSVIRTQVKIYIEFLTETISIPRRRTLESLLRLLRNSKCIKYYPTLRKEFLTEEQWEKLTRKHGNRSGCIFRNNRGEVRYLRSPNLEILLADYLSGPHMGVDYEGKIGFIYGYIDKQSLFDTDVSAYIMREEIACTSCDACYVIFTISKLLYELCSFLLFWNLAEVSDLVLRGTPLPPYIGYVDVCNPGPGFIRAEIPEYSYTRQEDGLWQQKYERTAVIASAQFPFIGYARYQFLPFIPPASVAKIVQRVLPMLPCEDRQRDRFVSAKHFALYLHSINAVRFPSAPNRTEESQDCLLTTSACKELTRIWNEYAPQEWQFRGVNPTKSFIKALKKAYEAIECLHLRSVPDVSTNEKRVVIGHFTLEDLPPDQRALCERAIQAMTATQHRDQQGQGK